MSGVRILAASYLGPQGHGNDLSGLRRWPAEQEALLQQGILSELHWSMLFDSDPARFSRMDLMCRLGLMATELLDAGLEKLPDPERDRLATWVETSPGSLATDVRFLQTPRASLFTYTLSSTVIGEICIRYQVRGPILCLVRAPGESGTILEDAVCQLQAGDLQTCLCVGVDAVDVASAELFPEAASAKDWAAGAVLLGNARGSARDYPLATKPLLELCRGMVFGRAVQPAPARVLGENETEPGPRTPADPT